MEPLILALALAGSALAGPPAFSCAPSDDQALCAAVSGFLPPLLEAWDKPYTLPEALPGLDQKWKPIEGALAAPQRKKNGAALEEALALARQTYEKLPSRAQYLALVERAKAGRCWFAALLTANAVRWDAQAGKRGAFVWASPPAQGSPYATPDVLRELHGLIPSPEPADDAQASCGPASESGTVSSGADVRGDDAVAKGRVTAKALEVPKNDAGTTPPPPPQQASVVTLPGGRVPPPTPPVPAPTVNPHLAAARVPEIEAGLDDAEPLAELVAKPVLSLSPQDWDAVAAAIPRLQADLAKIDELLAAAKPALDAVKGKRDAAAKEFKAAFEKAKKRREALRKKLEGVDLEARAKHIPELKAGSQAVNAKLAEYARSGRMDLLQSAIQDLDKFFDNAGIKGPGRVAALKDFQGLVAGGGVSVVEDPEGGPAKLVFSAKAPDAARPPAKPGAPSADIRQSEGSRLTVSALAALAELPGIPDGIKTKAEAEYFERREGEIVESLGRATLRFLRAWSAREPSFAKLADALEAHLRKLADILAIPDEKKRAAKYRSWLAELRRLLRDDVGYSIAKYLRAHPETADEKDAELAGSYHDLVSAALIGGEFAQAWLASGTAAPDRRFYESELTPLRDTELDYIKRDTVSGKPGARRVLEGSEWTTVFVSDDGTLIETTGIVDDKVAAGLKKMGLTGDFKGYRYVETQHFANGKKTGYELLLMTPGAAKPQLYLEQTFAGDKVLKQRLYDMLEEKDLTTDNVAQTWFNVNRAPDQLDQWTRKEGVIVNGELVVKKVFKGALVYDVNDKGVLVYEPVPGLKGYPAAYLEGGSKADLDLAFYDVDPATLGQKKGEELMTLVKAYAKAIVQTPGWKWPTARAGMLESFLHERVSAHGPGEEIRFGASGGGVISWGPNNRNIGQFRATGSRVGFTEAFIDQYQASSDGKNWHAGDSLQSEYFSDHVIYRLEEGIDKIETTCALQTRLGIATSMQPGGVKMELDCDVVDGITGAVVLHTYVYGKGKRSAGEAGFRDAGPGEWGITEGVRKGSYPIYKREGYWSWLGRHVANLPVLRQLLDVGKSAVMGVEGGIIMMGAGIADVTGHHDYAHQLAGHALSTWGDVGIHGIIEPAKEPARDLAEREFVAGMGREAYDEQLEEQHKKLVGWKGDEQAYKIKYGDSYKSKQVRDAWLDARSADNAAQYYFDRCDGRSVGGGAMCAVGVFTVVGKQFLEMPVMVGGMAGLELKLSSWAAKGASLLGAGGETIAAVYAGTRTTIGVLNMTLVGVPLAGDAIETIDSCRKHHDDCKDRVLGLTANLGGLGAFGFVYGKGVEEFNVKFGARDTQWLADVAARDYRAGKLKIAEPGARVLDDLAAGKKVEIQGLPKKYQSAPQLLVADVALGRIRLGSDARGFFFIPESPVVKGVVQGGDERAMPKRTDEPSVVVDPAYADEALTHGVVSGELKVQEAEWHKVSTDPDPLGGGQVRTFERPSGYNGGFQGDLIEQAKRFPRIADALDIKVDGERVTVPDVAGLNARLAKLLGVSVDKLPRKFVEYGGADGRGGEAPVKEYLAHLAKGEILVSVGGRHRLHDLGVHMLGWLALPDEVFEAIKRDADDLVRLSEDGEIMSKSERWPKIVEARMEELTRAVDFVSGTLMENDQVDSIATKLAQIHSTRIEQIIAHTEGLDLSLVKKKYGRPAVDFDYDQLAAKVVRTQREWMKPVERPSPPRGDKFNGVELRPDPIGGGSTIVAEGLAGNGGREGDLAGFAKKNPELAAQLGITVDAQGRVHYPDVAGLNARLAALKPPPHFKFVEYDGGVADPRTYLEHWAKGEIIISKNGPDHFHDMAYHVMSALATPDDVMLYSQAQARRLLSIADDADLRNEYERRGQGEAWRKAVDQKMANLTNDIDYGTGSLLDDPNNADRVKATLRGFGSSENTDFTYSTGIDPSLVGQKHGASPREPDLDAGAAETRRRARGGGGDAGGGDAGGGDTVPNGGRGGDATRPGNSINEHDTAVGGGPAPRGDGTNPGTPKAKGKAKTEPEPTPVDDSRNWPQMKVADERTLGEKRAQRKLEDDYDAFSTKKYGGMETGDWIESVKLRPNGTVRVRLSLRHPLDSWRIVRDLEDMGFKVEYSQESPDEFHATRRKAASLADAGRVSFGTDANGDPITGGELVIGDADGHSSKITLRGSRRQPEKVEAMKKTLLAGGYAEVEISGTDFLEDRLVPGEPPPGGPLPPPPGGGTTPGKRGAKADPSGFDPRPDGDSQVIARPGTINAHYRGQTFQAGERAWIKDPEAKGVSVDRELAPTVRAHEIARGLQIIETPKAEKRAYQGRDQLWLESIPRSGRDAGFMEFDGLADAWKLPASADPPPTRAEWDAFRAEHRKLLVAGVAHGDLGQNMMMWREGGKLKVGLIDFEKGAVRQQDSAGFRKAAAADARVLDRMEDDLFPDPTGQGRGRHGGHDNVSGGSVEEIGRGKKWDVFQVGPDGRAVYRPDANVDLPAGSKDVIILIDKRTGQPNQPVNLKPAAQRRFEQDVAAVRRKLGRGSQ